MVSRPRPDAPERYQNRQITRVDRLENATPLHSTSVSNGRTRFIGEESLIVIGSQLVSGLLNVIGRLRVTGLGILEVLGLIELDGTMRVTGDIEILPGGLIKVGDMTIDPAGNGRVSFPDGGRVSGTAGGVSVSSGDYFVSVTGSSVTLGRPGRQVTVDGSGIHVSGMSQVNMAAFPDAFPGAVVYDGGELKRVV